MTDRQHGGARRGAGNKPLDPDSATVTRCITITHNDLAYLLSISQNVSEAVRILVAKDKQP